MNNRGWEAWEAFKQGTEFGELLNIVRDLAHESPVDRELAEICKFCSRTCGHWEPYKYQFGGNWNTGRKWIGTMTALDSHAEDCLWRRAREVLNDDEQSRMELHN